VPQRRPRIASSPLAVSLLALGAAIPISPYVTTISFAISGVRRLAARRRRGTAVVGFRP